MTLLCIILVLILIFYLKQWLTILDSELHHQCTCPENITVLQDVVKKNLGEDPPVLQPPVDLVCCVVCCVLCVVCCLLCVVCCCVLCVVCCVLCCVLCVVCCVLCDVCCVLCNV
jgi:hypothetical protein